MTSNDIARKVQLIKQHEKALGLPTHSFVKNGLDRLTVEDLAHGFEMIDGSLRFLHDPVCQYLFGHLMYSTQLEHELRAHLQGLPDNGLISLKRFYRNAGYAVSGYLELFYPLAQPARSAPAETTASDAIDEPLPQPSTSAPEPDVLEPDEPAQ